MSITWVDLVTPLDAVNMNKLEQTARKGAASGYAGLDASQNLPLVSAAQLIWNADTNLYRSGAAVLKTDGRLVAADASVCFLANPAGASGYAWYTAVGAEAQPRFRFNVNAFMEWGPGGSTAPDTNLYRYAANQLITDGYLYAGLAFYANRGLSTQVGLTAVFGTSAGIVFGSAGDTNFYRGAANSLKTDGALDVVGTLNLAYTGTAYGLSLIAAAPSANQTVLFAQVQGVGGRRFEVGAADSAGVGFRTLRVAN